VLAGCGGDGDAQRTTTVQRGERPLPVVAPDAACPVASKGPTAPHLPPGLGDGPAYPISFQRGAVLELSPPREFGSREWGGRKVLWAQSPGAPPGLVVTGQRLDGEGVVGFDDADPPVTRLSLPEPDPSGWVDRPGYTRIGEPGCYAYVVEGPGVHDVIVFRAVALRHWRSPGDVVDGRSARQLERAIVAPAFSGRNGLSDPFAAACRAPTARERTNAYAGSPWEFVCTITDEIGTRRYDVQVLPNWCYTAALQRRPGEHSRGIQACAAHAGS
jgi:hypothetical protein